MTVAGALTFRDAVPDEAGALGELVRRAKQSHGYDDTFMQALINAGDFVIDPDLIARNTFRVAEMDGRVVGVAHLMPVDAPGAICLEHLFIDPDAQGIGVGRALFRWAVDEARGRGFAWLEWESDPNAAAFYEKMGAERIGEKESTLTPSRIIPRIRVATGP